MKTYKKRGIYIKLDHNGMPMYSADNRNFYDTEREARQRKLDDAIAELKALSVQMFDDLMSIRVTQ